MAKVTAAWEYVMDDERVTAVTSAHFDSIHALPKFSVPRRDDV